MSGIPALNNSMAIQVLFNLKPLNPSMCQFEAALHILKECDETPAKLVAFSRLLSEEKMRACADGRTSITWNFQERAKWFDKSDHKNLFESTSLILDKRLIVEKLVDLLAEPLKLTDLNKERQQLEKLKTIVNYSNKTPWKKVFTHVAVSIALASTTMIPFITWEGKFSGYSNSQELFLFIISSLSLSSLVSKAYCCWLRRSTYSYVAVDASLTYLASLVAGLAQTPTTTLHVVAIAAPIIPLACASFLLLKTFFRQYSDVEIPGLLSMNLYPIGFPVLERVSTLAWEYRYRQVLERLLKVFGQNLVYLPFLLKHSANAGSTPYQIALWCSNITLSVNLMTDALWPAILGLFHASGQLIDSGITYLAEAKMPNLIEFAAPQWATLVGAAFCLYKLTQVCFPVRAYAASPDVEKMAKKIPYIAIIEHFVAASIAAMPALQLLVIERLQEEEGFSNPVSSQVYNLVAGSMALFGIALPLLPYAATQVHRAAWILSATCLSAYALYISPEKSYFGLALCVSSTMGGVALYRNVFAKNRSAPQSALIFGGRGECFARVELELSSSSP